MLGIYLNDHLAGATGGVELARRIAGSRRSQPAAATLRRLAAEIAEDRAALLDMMSALGIPVRSYKVRAAWIGEKAARLKLNGYLLARSPLSGLEELEMLRLGVAGKAAGWRTLRAAAGTDGRPTLAGLTSSFPARGARRMSSRNSACRPRRRSSRPAGQPMTPRQRRRGGVLFDVDGTLLDTNYLHVVAWWEAFRERGYDVRCADIHRAIGLGSDELIQRVLGRDDPSVSEAHSRYYAPYLGRMRPLPGARELLVATAKLGLSVVVATSAKGDEVGLMLDALDAGSAISSVVSSADVDRANLIPASSNGPWPTRTLHRGRP